MGNEGPGSTLLGPIFYQMVLLVDKIQAPVEVGSLSHYLPGFILFIPGGCLEFLNHQQ